MRWLLCAGAWLAANVAGLYVAAATKWGPVVVTLSARHGVHLGDILAVLLGVAVAMIVTGVVWATSPSRPPTRVVVAWVLCAAVWQVTVMAALFVAASTEWGPVVVRTWHHKPVHLGDILAVLLAVAVASTVTLVVWASSRPRPATPAAPIST